MTKNVIIPLDATCDSLMLNSMVTVSLTAEAREQFSELPRLVALRMEKLLARLSHWPRVSGVKHLRGALAGKCRLRTGDYRMQFYVAKARRAIEETRTIRGKEVRTKREVMEYAVVIEKVGHRDGFCEE